MKRGITVTAIITMLSLAVMAGPQIVWLNPDFDFGAFREEVGRVTCTFNAVNVGDEPVVVLSARANCGCTTPRYSREPVAPGDTLHVSVSYDASGRPGPFKKNVYVTTNAPEKVPLTIRGTVIGASNTLSSRFPVDAAPARLNVDIVPFGTVTKGHIAAGSVKIYNPTESTLRPTVTNLPAWLHAVFAPDTIPPGRMAILSLTADSGECDQYGLYTSGFGLVTDTARADTVEITTVIIINEDFSHLTAQERAKAPRAVYPTEIVDLGRFVPGEILNGEFVVENAGKSPLIIRRISSADEAVTIDVPETIIPPHGKSRIKVAVNSLEAAKRGEAFTARIIVITNSPDTPQNVIRVVGEVIEPQQPANS